MKIQVKKQRDQQEYWFKEGCYITEIANDYDDKALSIARVRVEPGTTTMWHKLDNVSERYIIISGYGKIEVGDDLAEAVESGDIIRIPKNSKQRISNTGRKDLVFYAVCTPPFTKDCYISCDVGY